MVMLSQSEALVSEKSRPKPYLNLPGFSYDRESRRMTNLLYRSGIERGY
jgi:hypothetical protein